MAEITVREITTRDEWEAFLSSHSEANFLHSWQWGEFQTRIGREVFYTGFYENERLIGVMLSIVEPARRAKYLTIPGGPIIDWQNQDLVRAVGSEMKHLGKNNRCVFVRVRPQLVSNELSKYIFKKLKFRPAQMHLHAELTSQLGITRELDDLRNDFRKNTRYELKRAKKRGIIVEFSDDPEAVDVFYDLQLETAQRHGFVPYGKKFLKEQFRVFADSGSVLLYSARTKDGQLIAQAYVIFYGKEAAYHYGASTELGRSEPGAYAIQWEAIKEAKRRGMSRYNFWGVVKPEQTKHRFYGVSVFKRGFRGEDVEYLHAHDLVLSWPKYLPNLFIEYLRRKRRHL